MISLRLDVMGFSVVFHESHRRDREPANSDPGLIVWLGSTIRFLFRSFQCGFSDSVVLGSIWESGNKMTSNIVFQSQGDNRAMSSRGSVFYF